MRFAVLSQPIGQRLYAPLLGLCDLSSHLLNHPFELRRELFDLLRAGILARQEDVFIEWHADAFPLSSCSPGAKPFQPLFLGKAPMLAGGEPGPTTRLAVPPKG